MTLYMFSVVFADKPAYHLGNATRDKGLVHVVYGHSISERTTGVMYDHTSSKLTNHHVRH